VRKDWPICKLGELSDIAYGYTEKARTEPVGPKFLRITDIQNDSVDWNAVPYCKIDKEEHQKHKLAAGDIVFARTGATTGKSYLVSNPPDAVCASYLIRLRLRSSELLPSFVSYYFSTKAYWDVVSTGISGSAQGGFNASKLAALQIPVPSLPEQQRIIAILDEAFAGLAIAAANAEKNLKNTRELFDSALNSEFQEREDLVPLATLATDITDGDHTPPPKTKDGVPFITISNIEKDTHEIDFSETFKVSDAYYVGLKENRKPRRGDVLYTVTGSFGIPVVVTSDKKFCFQRHIGLVRPKDGVDSKWLYYALRSRFAFDQAASGATGTAQKTVSLKLLRKLQLPRTSLSKQAAITTRLDALYEHTQQLVAAYRRKIEAAAQLKHSILQKAFAGELTAPPAHRPHPNPLPQAGEGVVEAAE
jgi:type I restriction enzyme S subunit